MCLRPATRGFAYPLGREKELGAEKRRHLSRGRRRSDSQALSPVPATSSSAPVLAHFPTQVPLPSSQR